MSSPYIEGKFSAYRAFLAYMMAHPGKKLLFMGQEFAQYKEWDYEKELEWFLLEKKENNTMLSFSKSLNKFYLNNSPLWETDNSWEGFSWIAHDDYKQSVIAFRRINDAKEEIVVVCNFVPVEHEDYRIGVPLEGSYELIFDTDAVEFGGSGYATKKVKVEEIPAHGFETSISLKLAPLSVIYLKNTPPKTRKKRVQTEKEAEQKLIDTIRKKSENKTENKTEKKIKVKVKKA
jgi:1,4-alpha-glucan branching enzyme